MSWTTSDRVIALRERSPVIDIAVETLDGWRRHLSSRNASVLAFWSFLSIFPALLAATTILGFVLQNNEQLQQDIVDGAMAEIPVLGDRLAEDPTSLSGNIWALVIGLGGALWSATRAFVGLQSSLDDTWEIHIDERSKLPAQRGKALAGIVLLGGAQVVSITLTALVNRAGLPDAGRVLLTVGAVAINIAVIAVLYRLMTSASPTWRDVAPGAVIAGIAYSLLQYAGTWIVESISDNAGETYGTFAIVLGIVTWLGFVAIATIMSAELNAAIVRRRPTEQQTIAD
ncbi:MAG: YihY/virulence factor BrkB family protein [Ilumatobacteraceae bacterium]|nr:YihY/virulence factor BrkB family protein [Ilumatobacteraceae bacterium]